MKEMVFLSLLLCIVSTSVTAEQSCEYKAWSEYKNTNLLRNADTSAYMFRSNHVRIDADGAPNAYHPDDIILHCTQGVGFKGLDCPANGGYPNTSWWPSVLVPDPERPNQAYIQPNGIFAGYFVSQTALKDRGITDVTDPARYVDATRIPFLVFPGSFYKKHGTGLLGDLGYAINLTNGKSSAFVVADIGPSKAELGEISIELGERLGGETPNPRTGEGSPKGEILYVLFPYSSKSNPWPLTVNEIDQKAKLLLEKSGGIEVAKPCQ